LANGVAGRKASDELLDGKFKHQKEVIAVLTAAGHRVEHVRGKSLWSVLNGMSSRRGPAQVNTLAGTLLQIQAPAAERPPLLRLAVRNTPVAGASRAATTSIVRII